MLKRIVVCCLKQIIVSVLLESHFSLIILTDYSAALFKLQRSRASLSETGEHDRLHLFKLGDYGVRPGVFCTLVAAAPAFITSMDACEVRLERIQKYFRREVRELEGFSDIAKSSEDIKHIECRTLSLVAQTKDLEMMINSMQMSPAIVIFVINVMWTAMSVMLTSLDVWYGSVLLLINFGWNISGDVYRLLALTRLGLQ